MTGERVLDWFEHARGGVDPTLRDQLIERFEVSSDQRIHELSKGTPVRGPGWPR
jgi:hypothetical protein